MRTVPEVSGVTIVLVGNFNPSIFTPAWFALHGLLTKQAADNADLQVAHPDLTMFSTEWLSLRVTTDRFEAESLKEPYVRLRDFLVRVFNEFVPHTPLTAIGILRDVHFCVAGDEQDRIFELLAPSEPWGRWKDDLELDQNNGGMISLTMIQPPSSDGPLERRTRVVVEPSTRIADGQFGIYVRVNDYGTIRNQGAQGRMPLMDFLENGFEQSVRRSNEIVEHIVSLGQERGGDRS